MELHAVKLLLGALDGSAAAAVGGGHHLEAGGQRLHLHAMAHPVHGGGGDILKQRALAVMGQLYLAVLTGLGPAALAAQQMDHQLLAVADAQHGNTHREQGGIHHGSIGFEYRGGATGENESVGLEGPNILHRLPPGADLAVYTAFTDTASHQQIILATEVQH